jgi:TRAP-type C4-dicarboxylate transport system permease small subunit
MAHARAAIPTHLLGRGITFMNFVFMSGGGLMQWLSGRFVQGAASSGLPSSVVYSRLQLGFAVILLVGAVIYAGAPGRPEPCPDGSP